MQIVAHREHVSEMLEGNRVRSRKIFAGLAGLSLLVAGAATAVPASAASGGSQAAGDAANSAVTTTVVPTPPPIHWTKCADEGLQSLHASCGFVSVPLDYSNPNGTKIQLAVSRVPHTVAN